MISSWLSSVIGILKKCREQLKRKWLLTLYSTFFMPHTVYCILVWGRAPSTSIRKIKILQKRALKTILGLKLRTSSTIVFNQAKVLNFNQIHVKQLLVFMFKYKQNLLPEPLQNLFTMRNLVVTRSTRQKTPYYIYPPRLESTQQSLFFSGPNLWNELDPTHWELNILHAFKSTIHELLLSNRLDLHSMDT